MNIDIVISFVTASVVLAITPGPDNIFVLMQSLVHGKKYGLATVLGLVSGCLVHTTLVAFGVSAIIKSNDNLFLLIKVLGAIYLLYLAFKVYKSSDAISLSSNNIKKKSLLELFKQGFIMNVLNPKVSIFFLAFFPGFLFSDTLDTLIQFYVLGILFMLVSFLVFSLITILSSKIAAKIKTNTKIGFYLKWLQIITFILISILIVM